MQKKKNVMNNLEYCYYNHLLMNPILTLNNP